MLTQEDLVHFRQRLESERDAIRSRVAARSRDAKETVQDESGVGDSGDQSVRLNDLDVEANEDVVDRVLLAEVERALRRIEDGAYGVTEISGNPIPQDPPAAQPHATTLLHHPSPQPP